VAENIQTRRYGIQGLCRAAKLAPRPLQNCKKRRFLASINLATPNACGHPLKVVCSFLRIVGTHGVS
jgi:hypothetical protein